MGDIGRGLMSAGESISGLSDVFFKLEQLKQNKAETAAELENKKLQKEQLEFSSAKNRIEFGLQLPGQNRKKYFAEGAGRSYLGKLMGGEVDDQVVDYFSGETGAKLGLEVIKGLPLLLKDPTGAGQKWLNDLHSNPEYNNDIGLLNNKIEEGIALQQKIATLQKTQSEATNSGPLADANRKKLEKFNEIFAKTMETRPDANPLVVKKYAARAAGLSLSRLDLADNDDATQAQAKGAGAASPGEAADGPSVFNPNSFKEEAELRQEFERNEKVQNFDTVNTYYQQLQKAVLKDTTAADIAIVYNFFKIQDPPSRVTQGEVTTTQKVQNVPGRFIGLYNNLVTGKGRLRPEVRQEILDISRDSYEANLTQYNNFSSRYRSLAAKRGLDPDNVIVNRSFAQEDVKNNEEERTAPNGKIAVYDRITKKFLRYK